MTTMTVYRNAHGDLDGFTEEDKRKWNMFKNELRALDPGELCQISHWFTRSHPFHNLHMRVVRSVFEGQELFTDFDNLRKWLYVGADHVDMIPGRDGKLVPVPKSFSFTETDDAEARIVHTNVVAFLRTEYAQRTLWPHLSRELTYETIETILAQYERQE